MSNSADLPAEALRALQKAWSSTINDYDLRRLNSERCVQASLYHHLRAELAHGDFTIFVEPYVSIGGAKPCFIDLLVSHSGSVVLALELKYKPSSKPSARSVAADLTKLIQFKHRRASLDRTDIVIRRFLSEKQDKLTLKIAPRSFAVFAAFVKEAAFPVTSKAFWDQHRDAIITVTGMAARSMPNRLVTLIAATKLENKASAVTWAKRKTTERMRPVE